MNAVSNYKSKEFQTKLMGVFKTTNPMHLPRISKVVVNVGAGQALADKEFIKVVDKGLARITGQTPVNTKAKNSIAGFKLKAGLVIGSKVTLRGDKMHDFLFKLINAVLPRIRDFKGVSDKLFDGQANMNIGLREYALFPEIKFDEITKPFGLGVNIHTTAKSKEEARQLLEAYGLIFIKDEE
jgi:large subunit ribosomal protein L5